MNASRFHEIAVRFSDLSIAVVGDFCLDRYLEIDSAREETSIETGLPVHNVVNVRAQPGGAGTVLNNLVALGIGRIFPIGFVGEDGEGLELWYALQARRGVQLDHFARTDLRRTFTYCKPLLVAPGRPSVELNRLDFKNWTPTPALLQGSLVGGLMEVSRFVNAIVVLDQVTVPETGVVTERMIEALGTVAERNPRLPILADSRRGLGHFPRVTLKMNAAELAALIGTNAELSLVEAKDAAAGLARRQGRNVFVTLAERGILAATPEGQVAHEPALPLRAATIDIVGGGDAVTANLATALPAGATLREALQIANLAGSIVIHKLGTTGTASVAEMLELLAGTGAGI
jgi:rfaE bifunctional protein kinase chain/domain